MVQTTLAFDDSFMLKASSSTSPGACWHMHFSSCVLSREHTQPLWSGQVPPQDHNGPHYLPLPRAQRLPHPLPPPQHR